MEAAALFGVAQVRSLQLAAAFAISDSLADLFWDPQFHGTAVEEGLISLYNASITVLQGSGSYPAGGLLGLDGKAVVPAGLPRERLGSQTGDVGSVQGALEAPPGGNMPDDEDPGAIPAGREIVEEPRDAPRGLTSAELGRLRSAG